MAFTMSMSGRRWPIFFGGITHGHNLFTAQCSNMASRTPALSSVSDDDDGEEDEEEEAAAPEARNSGLLVLSTHLEYPALADEAGRDGFAVMVRVKAPVTAAAEAGWRKPVDLAAVVDVSGSMAGAKLELAKRAVGFIVDSLGPRDRLSVVAFSSDGGVRRVVPLTRMSENGKATARRAAESLAAAAAGSGPADVRRGLDEAAKVLDGSYQRGVTAGVILLSDGEGFAATGDDGDYSTLVPAFYLGVSQLAQVHAFGLGAGHGAAAMHGVSAATGGTFSFIDESHAHAHAAVREAVAQCVGGLVSVAAEGVWIDADCRYLGVRVRAVESGRYESCIDDHGEDGKVTVSLGDLCAGQERRFLVFFDVGSDARDLMELKCNYRDTATGLWVDVSTDGPCWVERHQDDDAAAGVEEAPSAEVKRELLRVAAAQDMARAREAAERGAYAEAARILGARRESLLPSLSGAASSGVGGGACSRALAAELRELSGRVSCEREYRGTGRASLLAGMSAHAQQRGPSVGLEAGYAGWAMFATPAMRKLLRARRPPGDGNGNSSAAVVHRPRLEARLASAAPRLSMLRRCRRLLLKC